MKKTLGSEYQERINFLIAHEQRAIDERNEARNEVARLLGALKQTRVELQIQRNEVIRLRDLVIRLFDDVIEKTTWE
ncbi:hypothetical protein LCGC14_2442690 [marine sediment metagenome]|uniref:Uncharacterized protein n=1 Tax=marine sediment metagenome TaxID=412755 RepID=A0A0F9DVK0_9ZZZZ